MPNTSWTSHSECSKAIKKPVLLPILMLVACQLLFAQSAVPSHPGLASTPPMGWANWNHFACDYNDQTIRDQADALVASGMRDLGYRYVLIQECIAPSRNATGAPVEEVKRFPHGLKNLVDYLHARGLKAGIYTDVALFTCWGKPYVGSYGYEDRDAQSFADWGFDFVEMDYCNLPSGVTGRSVYERMAAAIQKTGRPMLLFICSWGNEEPWTWAQGKAQLWRTESDISNDWPSIVLNFESNARHAVFNAPDSWNDADMLEVGNTGLSLTEAQSNFSLWAISAAPLWAGNDLTTMSEPIRAIYTNAELIAVNQDPLGAGPTRVSSYGSGIEVWKKNLGSSGSGVQAVLLLNRADHPLEASVLWRELGLLDKVQVRDLWAHKDLGVLSDGYKVQLPAHGSVVLKVKGNFSWNQGAVYEAEWPGNLRSGKTTLTPCPECSQGYAVTLQWAGAGAADTSLAFTHVGVPEDGTYIASLEYVYNTLQDPSSAKIVQVQVNDGKAVDLPVQQDAFGTAEIPVELKKGDNTVTIKFDGEGWVAVDRLVLTR